MTVSFKTSCRQTAFAVVMAVPFAAMASSASLAYTAEAQRMCTGDAFRLCSSEIPNIPKITACMIKHRADLSEGCRAVMDKDKAQKSSTVAEQ